MNPGLVVKLRPAGPWRIGPDSGARNRVDTIYHSDSLYSAVTAAMARLSMLEEWLDATARSENPAVSFSSCFPFVDEIGFVVPPRTIWPPRNPALVSTRTRWKSARFVPLGIVQALLAGQTLDDNQWNVDGPSECLVPAGTQGPFRTGVRWAAAVDRLTGATERHSTACIEFRPGSGLWTVVAFADDSARNRWSEPVKAAFRLLADMGFGGERSRGWGRSETPEFLEGNLPEMILGGQEVQTAKHSSVVDPPVALVVAPVAEEPAIAEPVVEETAPVEAVVEEPLVVEEETAAVEAVAVEPVPTDGGPDVPPLQDPEPEQRPVTEPPAPDPEPPGPDPEPTPAPEPPVREPEPSEPEPAPPQPEPGPEDPEPTPLPLPLPVPQPVMTGQRAHWMLSLFTPAASDAVDWGRGNYTVLARSGRVDSPAGSGELKKMVHMVAEGSVVYAPAAPRGSAADVAPDGFAHPVFRAGFAVAIPLPEVS